MVKKRLPLAGRSADPCFWCNETCNIDCPQPVPPLTVQGFWQIAWNPGL